MGHAHAALRPIGPCVLSVQMSVFIINVDHINGQVSLIWRSSLSQVSVDYRRYIRRHIDDQISSIWPFLIDRYNNYDLIDIDDLRGISRYR